MHHDKPITRKSVPLALGLISSSSLDKSVSFGMREVIVGTAEEGLLKVTRMQVAAYTWKTFEAKGGKRGSRKLSTSSQYCREIGIQQRVYCTR